MLTIRWLAAVVLPGYLVTSCAVHTASAKAADMMPQAKEYSRENVSSSGQSTTGQCLQLPDTPSSRGDIVDDDIERWINIKNWEFITNSVYLSTDFTADGHAYLQQKLQPTEKGSVRVVGRGELIAARTYSLTQSLYLKKGFDWGAQNEGGKLGFGLGGNTSPTGGDTRNDGFSARLMWRGNGDGSARLVVYAYTADRNQNLPYGDDYILKDFQVPVGEWFTVTLEVTANFTTKRTDGSIRAWVNDDLKLQRNGIHWQSEGPEPLVDRLLYATFHGGNDPTWSPDQAVYARFKSVCWQPHKHNTSNP